MQTQTFQIKYQAFEAVKAKYRENKSEILYIKNKKTQQNEPFMVQYTIDDGIEYIHHLRTLMIGKSFRYGEKVIVSGQKNKIFMIELIINTLNSKYTKQIPRLSSSLMIYGTNIIKKTTEIKITSAKNSLKMSFNGKKRRMSVVMDIFVEKYGI